MLLGNPVAAPGPPPPKLKTQPPDLNARVPPPPPPADVLLLPVIEFLDGLGRVHYFTHSGVAATRAALSRRAWSKGHSSCGAFPVAARIGCALKRRRGGRGRSGPSRPLPFLSQPSLPYAALRCARHAFFSSPAAALRAKREGRARPGEPGTEEGIAAAFPPDPLDTVEGRAGIREHVVADKASADKEGLPETFAYACRPDDTFIEARSNDASLAFVCNCLAARLLLAHPARTVPTTAAVSSTDPSLV